MSSLVNLVSSIAKKNSDEIVGLKSVLVEARATIARLSKRADNSLKACKIWEQTSQIQADKIKSMEEELVFLRRWREVTNSQRDVQKVLNDALNQRIQYLTDSAHTADAEVVAFYRKALRMWAELFESDSTFVDRDAWFAFAARMNAASLPVQDRVNTWTGEPK